MDDDTTPDAARADLDLAEGRSAAVRARARWMATYLAAFGIGFGALTLVLGLAEDRPLRVALFVGWAVFCLAMVAWAARRPAHLRGTSGRTGRWWGITAALYAVALAAGLPTQVGNPAFWAPAALVVATPMLVGAARERRA